jgi:hypothetical protein
MGSSVLTSFHLYIQTESLLDNHDMQCKLINLFIFYKLVCVHAHCTYVYAHVHGHAQIHTYTYTQWRAYPIPFTSFFLNNRWENNFIQIVLKQLKISYSYFGAIKLFMTFVSPANCHFLIVYSNSHRFLPSDRC